MVGWPVMERLLVLCEMRGDLSAREWADRMGVSIHTIHADSQVLGSDERRHRQDTVMTLMAQAGLSTDQLAERWGIKPGTVRQWRNGRVRVPAHRLTRLAKLAGVTDY